MSEPAWLLGHISDLHLGGRETAGDRAEAVLAHLAALHRPLDALVLTGDLSDAGQQADYQWLTTRLGRFAHVVAVPGNHDDREMEFGGMANLDAYRCKQLLMHC